MARDIVATPAYKRTELPTKTELHKERSKSPLKYRREAEDDKFFMPPPPPPPTVLIADSPSPVNNHEYCTNCNQLVHVKIMYPCHVKKTCRKCGEPAPNIITCGSLANKAVRPRNLKPLPEITPRTRGPSNVHLIQKGTGGNFCSAPTPDDVQ